jgi:hypothetical protein
MANGNTSSTTVFTAASAIALLEQIEGSVPGFTLADRKVWMQIRRKVGYPDNYVQTAANMVDASPELQAATHFDAAAARAAITLSNEIRALIQKGESFLDGLRFTDAKLRASLVDGCDQVNALAPGLARKDKALDPHIDALRHASRRKGGRKKAAATPAPAPAPNPHLTEA